MSQRREQKICALVVWMNIAFLVWYAKFNSNSVYVYIRVTFKIKDQDFHLMTKSLIHSKTMQKLCRFGALSRTENQCKCHKDRPQMK